MLRYLAPMGLYRDHVVPRLVELTCGAKGIERFRRSAMEGLSGRILEIGFGSGLNVPHYPTEVTEVLAVEPAATARRIAESRISASGVPVLHVGLDGQSVELPDASCDAALCTFSLCTIPDPAAARGEVARILVAGGRLHLLEPGVAPEPGVARILVAGGRLHLLEHGVAPDPGVARWQRRIDPIERRIADGCHLSRDPVGLLESAGFRVERLEQRYVSGPKPWSYFTIAVASSPSTA